ncbi:hypothetical protein LTR84_008577 [Exophiala bonariae]|uniref:CYTH domain-containing protein n=1 Tax=Exophiala bonariae TaxID=1690606 RepID=A0AAV9MYV4_9EURO|nr:hypothetical protein LTR84_008577 [Exophiala bonariae]
MSNLVPDFEVKLLLNPSKVLDSNNKLAGVVQSEFSIQQDVKTMSVQFVDNKTKDIYNSGWNLRIRRTEGAKKIELTYKKRYPIDIPEISTTEETEGGIGKAVAAAANDGFNSTTDFEAQVEVGHKKQTLSISHSEKASAKGLSGVDLPGAEASGAFLIADAPPEFKNWPVEKTWPVVYGPVVATRLEGVWNGEKLYIEIWPIRASKTDATLVPIVEASFKTSDVNKALGGRQELADLLQSKGWFIPGDSLKTQLVMDRYGQ